ncbi:hypothetical protein [Caproiciproducens sp. LBM24188]|nr:hypothetical protein [Oscillospiraceae bacterium]HHV31041.1 hypothetical protein [Clostridiales bacterium]
MEKQSQQQEKARRKLYRGYEKLAFGGIADAVRLLFVEEPDLAALGKMDLYNIAEIKRPKGGGMEIKFFDRIKAMQCLEEMNGENGKKAEALPLYRALQECVRSFGEETHDKANVSAD